MCDEIENKIENKRRVLYLSGEITEESVLPLKQSIVQWNMDDDDLDEAYYLENEGLLSNVIVEGTITSLSLSPLERQPINIFIDSGGGAIYAGLSLINIIKTSNTPINTIVDGKAMSMAFLIALSGNYRLGFKNSTWMYHDGSFGVWSDNTDIKRELKEAERLGKIYDDLVKEWSYITEDWIKEIKDKRKNYYFDGIEALELGVVDELLDHNIDEELYNAKCDICGVELCDCECGEDE